MAAVFRLLFRLCMYYIISVPLLQLPPYLQSRLYNPAEICYNKQEKTLGNRIGGSMRILVLNGPNLNLLGMREPEIYGRETYASLCERLTRVCEAAGVGVEFFQSNHEGVLVDRIQEARGHFDGIVINPAAYTHTSIALLDAVKAVGIPTVEVHISDPDTREPFRRISYIRAACIATVKGKGLSGYEEAIKILCRHLGK